MIRSSSGARGALVAVVCLAIVSPRTARAEANGEIVEGVIVEVEKDDMVLDVGSLRGVSEGDVLEVWRPLRIRHPVSGRTLVDRILIGRVHLVQVRPNLSLSQLEETPSRPLQAGDVVRLVRVPPPPPAPALPPAAVGAPPAHPAPGGIL